jgi:hypothetical protein
MKTKELKTHNNFYRNLGKTWEIKFYQLSNQKQKGERLRLHKGLGNQSFSLFLFNLSSSLEHLLDIAQRE